MIKINGRGVGLAMAFAALTAGPATALEAAPEGLPEFNVGGIGVSEVRQTDAEVPAVSGRPVANAEPKSYREIIAANRRLAEIVERLDLSAAPPEVQEALRAQARSMAEGTRRLPSFVRQVRWALEGKSFFARMARKIGEKFDSADPGKGFLGFAAAKIGELVAASPAAKGASIPLPGQDAKPGAAPPPALAIPPGTDPSTAFMMKLRAIEGDAYEPHSDLALANLALGVAFNNFAAEIRQLVPEELYPLAEELNAAAAAKGLKGVDPEAMKSISLLMDQARKEDSRRFDASAAKLLAGAPEGFKKRAEEIMAQSVYRNPAEKASGR